LGKGETHAIRDLAEIEPPDPKQQTQIFNHLNR
jgi:hypothetical protein